MRKNFIAGNWKMHKTTGEAVALAKDLVSALAGGPNKYMIAPSFTALDAVSKVVSGTNILLGAQNMSTDEQGAHTGEVSVLQLKDLGVQVVILGHSERRHTYSETDDMINRKVKLALSHGLEVILCVGELLEEREAGKAEAVCEEQTRKGLAGVSADDLKRVTIAYEPVWAIGTENRDSRRRGCHPCLYPQGCRRNVRCGRCCCHGYPVRRFNESGERRALLAKETLTAVLSAEPRSRLIHSLPSLCASKIVSCITAGIWV